MGVNPIYKGADYKFEYGEDPFAPNASPLVEGNYRINASQLGVTTDPRVAHQLKEVSDKLSTGAKTIEVSGVSSEILESIPKQHFKEMQRLKELVGADLTFHGPLVEPTGVVQDHWDETTRRQAERQIWDAVARSHDLNPNGNTVVTLHTSSGLIAPSVRMLVPDENEEGKKKEKIMNLAVIDERSGRVGMLPKAKPDVFLSKTELDPYQELKDINKEIWSSELDNLSIETKRGRDEIRSGMRLIETPEKKPQEITQLYKLFRENKRDEYEKFLNTISHGSSPQTKEIINEQVQALNLGEVFISDSYRKFREMYNKAYEAAEKEKDMNKREQQLKVLDEYKAEAAEKLEMYKKDPLKVREFSDELVKGISVLNNLYRDEAPEMYKPLETFAVEKASETFGNVAFNAYKQFGDKAPIISLENPPVGTGLSRADEIKKLVQATQDHFKKRAMDEEGLSEQEADEQAKKLIGVTWDVGHINMLRKYGYGDKELIEETKQIKENVKHIHLSDNFGLEHTELPMGMGNVPLKEHLKELGEKAAKAKQIIETGGAWYRDFKTSPLPEVMHALGSPIYPMQMQPYWNTAAGMAGVPGYFSGYGYNPEGHHNIYGTGFSGLPIELGGQVQARGSRLGGTPME